MRAAAAATFAAVRADGDRTASMTNAANHGRTESAESVGGNGTTETVVPPSAKTRPATAAAAGASPSRRANAAKPATRTAR